MRQGNNTRAEYYNRRQVNFKLEPPKRGLKQYHPMGDFEYEPPRINTNHQPGEGMVTKGVLIPAYAISIYLLILAIACMVASFVWWKSRWIKKPKIVLSFFRIVFFIIWILFLLTFLDSLSWRFNLFSHSLTILL